MSLAKPVPPISRPISLNRELAPSVVFDWLAAGWSDFKDEEFRASLLYGLFVYALSIGLIGALFVLQADYALLPALAAFMVFAPVLAVGLYEKSRRMARHEPVSLNIMLDVRSESPGQGFFIGLILLLLVILWLRAAVLVYALFFGMHPFPGVTDTIFLLFTTTSGWGLLFVGSLFGALFAALGFAISAFSIPMLLNEKTDAFTAIGASVTLVWNNLPVMLAWGTVVMLLFLLCILTGLLGLIIVFPWLGHATWHAYVDIRGVPGSPVMIPAIPDDDAQVGIK